MRYFILILGLIFFIGCGKQIVYKPVYKVRTVYLKPSDSILKHKISTPVPPKKESFINANPIERERLLTNYIIDLLKTIKLYKNKNNNILDWYKKTNDTGN